MRKCFKCGSELPDYASFCPECGSVVKKSVLSMPSVALALSILCVFSYFAIQYIISLVLAGVYTFSGANENSVLNRFSLADISTVISIFSVITATVILKLVFGRVKGCERQSTRPRRLRLRHLPLFAVLGASLQYVILFLTYLMPWPKEWLITHSENMTSATSGSLVLVILSVSVLTAIAEETVFRSIIVGILGRAFSPILCLIFSAVIFGAAHMSPIAFFYATILGLILGAIYINYRSILPSVIVHMFFNLAAILLPAGKSPLLDIALLLIATAFTMLSMYLVFAHAQHTDNNQ